MLDKARDRKTERIEQIVEHLRARMDKKQAPSVERFVRRFYQRATAADLAENSAENLYGAAFSLWKFAEQRDSGVPKVRVLNPRVDEQGWKSSHTVIEIVNDDMPFLVDSITANLNRKGYTVHLVIHPIVRVKRDAKGRLQEVVSAKSGSEAANVVDESHMHVEISAQSSPKVLDEIRESIHKVLVDVQHAVEDWRPMLAKVDEAIADLREHPPPVAAEETEETISFLEWLADNHFTFLGYREYTHRSTAKRASHKAVAGSGLGVLHNPDFHVLADTRGGLTELSPEVQYFLGLSEPIIVTKANIRSTVHRAVHMDYIGIKAFDEKGKVIGERRFIGLFTSAAYNQTPEQIPFLRRKVRRTIEMSGLAVASHDGKALANILDTFPRDELFQISEEQLHDTAIGILEIHERPRISVFYRRDPFRRYVSCLVYVQTYRHSTELTELIGKAIAQAFNGYVSVSFIHVGDSPLARIQYIIATKEKEKPEPPREELEELLRAVARTWRENLHDELLERFGEERGIRLWHKYGTAFPTSYAEAFSTQEATFDIDEMEEVVSSGRIGMNLYRAIEAPENALRFKLFHQGGPLPLSDTLPMLENMGFRVIEEHPFDVRLEGDGTSIWIHDYGLEVPAGVQFDLHDIKEKLQEAFGRVWYGELENDGFNRLVVRAGLEWREIVVLRAFCKYLRQTGITFSQTYMESTLAANAGIARDIVRLFRTRFDPHDHKRADHDEVLLVLNIEMELEAVVNLDEDRILRKFLNLVRSILRTNFFQPADDGSPKPYVSFKIDSRNIDELPLPRPFVETYVYSPRAEAIHLRGGTVARGGLRWSDRPEDFRTEILGLLKAQMVKNAVIVPVGAKGGFVAKRLPTEGGREAVQAEVVECYKILIRGLLDLADNSVDGKVVPPKDVVRFDDDDPYLVVAADKGTATFSDIANGVAIDYGFWLGDAFASGGSEGYDHKGMGITARGAWESVKRHFREIGHDTQTEDFTVVGIGDMSGDVFGNGMLLSRHIKLIGAFNHLHIFVDPDPDPARTWTERKRLFELPRSAWTDFDKKLISKGGDVFDRSAKSVRLTPQIKRAFGIKAESMTPNELIHAMLTSEVDLLWFGGIGTYVKSEGETNLEVGDRANDALRINGKDLRARVVGEGANLGVTQRGRVEYAFAGGRINTDAIDNSGGVDCSDHEVNIKVLLDSVVSADDMTPKQRAQLLVDMTDEVAELVLRNNYLQTQAISTVQSRGTVFMESEVRFMRALERSGKLDRAIEFLPDEEMIVERETKGLGFSRPEISVLLAYGKMTLYEELLGTDVPEDPYFTADLVAYFPSALRKKFVKSIGNHSLRREIVATQIANSIVNRAGLTFVNDIIEDTQISVADIARAYVATRDAFDLRTLWADIAKLDNKLDASLQTEMMIAVENLIRHATMWFLKNVPQPMNISDVVETYAPGIAAMAKSLDGHLADLEAAALQERVSRFVGKGVPVNLARRVAGLEAMRSVCHIVHAAASSGWPIDEIGRTYFAIGARLGLDWLRSAAEKMELQNHWERLAVGAVIEDLYGQQRTLVNRVVDRANGVLDEQAVTDWVDANSAAVTRMSGLINEFRLGGNVGLAQLTIVNRHMASMLIS